MAIYLDGENISTGGQVEYYRCDECTYETFCLQLYRDTDSVYIGIISVTSTDKAEIVITRLTPHEFQRFGRIPKQAIAERINTFLGRTDLIYVANKQFLLNNGEMVFEKACPKCQAHMSRNEHKSLETFVSEGGKVITFSIHQRPA
ncbi:hypothetical protein WG947_01505 [Pontibacter sp. H259]|uniref:hypothetical protein n=1 Tax=Pontibacter sp. H259 TaxID=3133421 RepID=UPI0030BAED80